MIDRCPIQLSFVLTLEMLTAGACCRKPTDVFVTPTDASPMLAPPGAAVWNMKGTKRLEPVTGAKSNIKGLRKLFGSNHPRLFECAVDGCGCDAGLGGGHVGVLVDRRLLPAVVPMCHHCNNPHYMERMRADDLPLMPLQADTPMAVFQNYNFYLPLMLASMPPSVRRML